MKNAVFFLLVLAIAGYSEFDSKTKGTNINPWSDTAAITGLKEASTYRYTTTCFDISPDQPLRIICMANDTDAAGFASDSINFQWGYQTGTRVLNASGLLDTVWYNRVLVDQMLTDSLGISAIGTISAAGVPTMVTSKQADTSSVTGYAVQSRPIGQLWDEFMRLWAVGVSGINTSSAIKLKFVVKNRVAQPVRAK